MNNFWAGKKILVTGASGFVGSNFIPLLRESGCELAVPSRQDYDLLQQDQVRQMLGHYKPEIVFHFAGLIGGIGANKARPADFLYENLLMGTAMLHECFRAGVQKYVTLMGGCSYPAHAPSPIKETELFNGMPQAESAPYSLAKAMSAVQAAAYRRQHNFNAVVLVPGNLYGPGDNFDLNNSHVIPALIRKFVDAKAANTPEVSAWGSGKPTRDFVYISDACEAILIAAEKYNQSDIINVSSGQTISIKLLTETIAELTGYQGKVVWDVSKPDGQLYKGFDVTRMKEILGYECRTSLRDGIRKTIDWYLSKPEGLRL
ncbi:MAG TPA: GDP-L-fucose synthase [Verrucomicrobiae bacterium]|jgi:GDP-L-fucose synthase|nr:GDP-L-fucose synthase [Verrucomicrobiae bacterium]